MDSSASHLKRRIDCLLSRLDQFLLKNANFQPLLDYHCNFAAFEIRANFDSLINTLKQRELTLLQQLNVVYKEKALQIESHRQNIEKLRAAFSSLSSDSLVDPSLNDLLMRAERDLENSVSDPFISFRMEHSTLPLILANYGRVVSRYGGHFASSGQKSTSLPLELEEEDDDPDESCAQSAVCSQFTPVCNCVKPELQQWLADVSHTCSRGRTCTNIANLNSFFPASIKLRGNKIEESEYASSLPSSRNRVCSWAFKSTNAANNTVHEDSPSISVLSDSAVTNSDALKDWLFCDTPVQLHSMPGLSHHLSRNLVSSQPKQHRATLCDNLARWLVETGENQDVPHSDATSTTTSTCLLHSHLTQSGPIDLDKWLIREHPPSSIGPSEVASTEFQPPTNPPSCVQCHGGPGGPTCCGARLKDSQPEPLKEVISAPLSDWLIGGSDMDGSLNAEDQKHGSNLRAPSRIYFDQLRLTGDPFLISMEPPNMSQRSQLNANCGYADMKTL